MRKEEKAALDVLAKASDVHNCWAILDEAVTSGEDDGFTHEYIEGAGEMLEGSILAAASALRTLGKSCGIDAKTGNGSYAYMRKVREEHLTELERAKEFDRGYRAGQRAMDAERQSVALKLRRLSFDGGSHENLSQIARAIWHNDFGWTRGACEGLRDELVRLMGGVSGPTFADQARDLMNTIIDEGNRKLASDDGTGDSYRGVTIHIDEQTKLDVERMKSIAKLRKFEPMIGGKPTEEASKLIRCITGKSDSHAACINDLEETRDRLIHLLGGGTCNCDQGGDHGDCAERRRAGAAGGDTDVDESAEIRAVSDGIADALREMDAESDADGTSPNDVPTSSITDELREWASIEVPYKYGRQLHTIADRIEEQFKRLCWQQEAVLQATIDDMERERDELKAECDRLTAALDELHADPANDVICRLERERDELQRKIDQQRAMLTEQRDAARAKVIALCNELTETKKQRDELQAKLDEIKSVLSTDETEVSDAC